MDRGPKSVKRFLTKKWTANHMKIHHAKLQKVKPMIDNSCPNFFGLAKRKTKKDMAIEARYEEIEKDNLRLISRMGSILRSRPITRHQSMASAGSLNDTRRKKELDRINLEN